MEHTCKQCGKKQLPVAWGAPDLCDVCLPSSELERSQYKSVTELAADNPNLLEYLKQEDKRLTIATQTLDEIAVDHHWMKRQDMIDRAQHTLCRIGLWRKALPGEFCRDGISYGFPGGKPSEAKQEAKT